MSNFTKAVNLIVARCKAVGRDLTREEIAQTRETLRQLEGGWQKSKGWPAIKATKDDRKKLASAIKHVEKASAILVALQTGWPFPGIEADLRMMRNIAEGWTPDPNCGRPNDKRDVQGVLASLDTMLWSLSRRPGDRQSGKGLGTLYKEGGAPSKDGEIVLAAAPYIDDTPMNLNNHTPQELRADRERKSAEAKRAEKTMTIKS